MLGANDPSIWNVSWSQGTKIVAVMASGSDRQAVAGLDRDVPQLNATRYNHSWSDGCIFSPGSDKGVVFWETMAPSLFGKAVDGVVFSGPNGRIVVGDPIDAETGLVTSNDTPPESFQDPDVPLAGQAAIDAAVAKGLLRPATQDDVDTWVAALAAKGSERADRRSVASPRKPYVHRTYVLLADFRFPNGLGRPLVSFIIPEGVPRPMGQPGHATVYDLNSLTCQGPYCY